MDINRHGRGKTSGPLALHDFGHETLLTKEERRGQEEVNVAALWLRQFHLPCRRWKPPRAQHTAGVVAERES